jgi:putative salt-induced outer membrane protein
MRLTAFFASLALAASVFAADATPPKDWTGSLGAGLAITTGNTDTQNFNLAAGTKYDPKTKFVFKADALYLRSSTDGTKQVDKTTADARGEYTVSDRTFAFGEVSFLRDPFKSITYLVAPVVGAGYRIIKSDVRNLTVDGAVGGIVESNPVEGRTTSGAVKAGENFDWAISPTSKIVEKVTGLWKTNDFSDSFYHFDAGLATTVATRIELKLAYAYDYKNRPVPSTVKKGDGALTATLLYKF